MKYVRTLRFPLDASLQISNTSAPPGGRYARLLALAGTMHSDYTDVSTDKYKHLAEIYADNHEPSK